MNQIFKSYIWLLCLCVVLVSACGNAPGSTDTKGSAETKDAVEGGGDGEAGISVNKAVVIPPGYDDRPDSDVENPFNINNPDSAFSKNMKGLNLETLFQDDVDDVDDRFERLEQAVIDFRREYEDIRPAITRLVAIEADIQALIEDLEALVANDEPRVAADGAPVEAVDVADTVPETVDGITVAPLEQQGEKAEDAVVEAVEALEAKDKVEAPPVPLVNTPDVTPSGAKIENIRIGLHANKERIVIDFSAQNDYEVSLDNEQKTLSISLKGLNASAALIEAKESLKSYVMSSYAFKDEDDGLTVVFKLKANTEVLSTEWLGVSSDYQSHRLIVDLAN